jgi:hypothetical protein
MYLTGHNSYSGCRFCNLQGTLNTENNHVYYPLQQDINPQQLPIRTHDEMLNKISQIECLEREKEKESLIRECGWLILNKSLTNYILYRTNF